MAPSRRHFMMGGAGLMMSGAMPGPAGAALTEGPASVRAGIVLYRPMRAESRRFAEALSEDGPEAIALARDPVRQWREQIEPRLQVTTGPVYGLTDWSDYQLIRGLCAERRMHVRHESVHHDDRALFHWVIA